MSDIHVLTGNNNIGWTLAMHFAVPDVNNSVGVNFRTALVNSGIGVNEDGRRSIMVVGAGAGQINPAEEALIDAGELFESVGLFRVESGGTSPAQLQSAVRLFYAAQNTKAIDAIGSVLRYFGHTESAA